jgi:hypothetical protein
MSLDGESVLGVGGVMSVCPDCGEASYDATATEHAPGCSKARRRKPAGGPSNDPNAYVWTDRGIELASAVERRRRRERAGREAREEGR